MTNREYKCISVPSCFFRVSEIRRNGQVWGVLVLGSTDANVNPATKQAETKQGKAKSYNHVQVLEGRYSGKLLSIRLPINKPPFDDACLIELQTHARDAFESRRKQLGDQLDKILNQTVASKVIENDIRELVGA